MTPKPVTEPLLPLEPIAPASAERPLGSDPRSRPQSKTAAEILAESAEADRGDSAAQPPMTKPSAESPEPPAPAPESPAPPPAPTEEPAAEEPAEKPMSKQPAPKAVEENLFDETDEADGDAPARKPAPAKKPADEAPKDDEKAASEDDPFALLKAEPVRRWIDDTGVHATVGRLVEVHPDRIRILKTNGRHATVRLERLSRHDQAYAAAAGERLAAKRPAITDTARR